MSFKCKFCVQEYCVSCIQYETHKCNEIEKMKEHHVLALNNRLQNEKTTDIKLKKI